MKIERRKIWITVLPLAVGALILASLWKISSPHKDAPAAATATNTPIAPENPVHEKASLEEQLKKNPGHPPILMRLAELERDAGKPAGAVPYLKKILEQDPKHEEARLELGRALYDTGDSDGALRETKQLIADHPANVDGLYNLGAIYANQNQFGLAREVWSKAVALGSQSDSGRKAQDGLSKIGTAK
jgi:cytochrome c-type biogenesis protein CcmH/NrfG